jgi:hypothetical protein
MRAIGPIVAALFLVFCSWAGPAKADSFVDLKGGLTTPVGDDDWNDTVESSPKLAIAIGSVPNTIGGMVSLDWTPYNTDAQADFPGAEFSAHRFRILGNLAFMSPLQNKLIVTGRMGIGADIQRGHAEGQVFGIRFETTDSDIGLGFELGAGLWVKVGGVAVGGEIAIPISHHDRDNDQGEIDFIYTTYDIDLLFGVRLMSDK